MSRQLHDHAIKAYFKSHQRAIKLCVERLTATPIANLITLTVITLAFFLPTALFVTINNLSSLRDQWDDGTQIHLYLAEKTPQTQAEKLAQELNKFKQIKHVDIILPEQGLQEFIAHTQSEDLADSFSENPLPTVLIVYPALSYANFTKLTRLKDQLTKRAIVEQATLDNLWIKRLDALTNLLRQLLYGLVSTLAVGIVFIIANSVRSTSQQYHPEISLFDMVGATPAYIRRPFLYSGAILGLLAGILTLVLSFTAIHALTPAIESISHMYNLSLKPHSLNGAASALLLLTGCILGYIGSYVAISLEIRRRA